MRRFIPSNITWLLLLYFAVGSAFVLVNPLFESPDEIHHVAMVQYLQSNNLQLPSQASGTVGRWQQEGNQPPLYYYMGALLITPFDTSNIDTVLRENPHADIGIIQPDFNGNRIVHNAALERFPGEGGMASAAYVLRFFSLLLGAGTVYVTYALGREFFPQMPTIALTAAAFVATLPMFVYISSSVNNDNLSTLLANTIVLLLVRLLKHQQRPDWAIYVGLGVLVGAGLLSKLNIGFLIPLVALSLAAVSWRLRDWRPFVVGGVISGGLTIVIAGWWYWRNWQLFNDPTGLDRFLEIVGTRADPATLAQLWTERDSFLQTFWGLFGSITVPLPEPIYLACNVLAAIGVLSAALFLVRRWEQGETGKLLPTLLVIIYPVIIFIALLRWTSITPASQGRLMFSALSGLALWFSVGWVGWLPRWFKPVMPGLVALLFGSLSALSLIIIHETYDPPQPIRFAMDEVPTAVMQYEDTNVAFDDIRILTPTVRPDEYVRFRFDAQLQTATPRNWSLFVHLVNDADAIVAQRDVYPGGGRLATSDLDAGRAWQNEVAVRLDPTTYAPQRLRVQVGWYHLPSGDRMMLPNGDDVVEMGTIEVLPRAGEISNPQEIIFGNRIQLIGYDVSALSAVPDETLTLTLHWRALRPLDHDYTVFANLIEPDTLTKYAASNITPVARDDAAESGVPSSRWAVREQVTNVHTLTISPDTPVGTYPIEIGLYRTVENADGETEFVRLGVTGTYDNFLHLLPIRIREAPQ